jgi:CheY-like chemotaxis protein
VARQSHEKSPFYLKLIPHVTCEKVSSLAQYSVLLCCHTFSWRQVIQGTEWCTLKSTILLVEPDSAVRNILTMLLVSAGYEVSTAEHGFDALQQLKKMRPDVLISDLTMPRMSGFELLSVVRRRFPEISVIAMSGAYEGHDLPCGVIADMFYSKGHNDPGVLQEAVALLIRSSGSRAADHQREKAPLWVPRIGAHFLLTCTECLRPFPLDYQQ